MEQNEINKRNEAKIKRWVKHYANIAPKKGYIDIVEMTFESRNPKFKKKRISTRVVKTVPITVEIPIYEYESEVHHFDSTAFQSDDRQFSTIEKYKAYDKALCVKLCAAALIGFNTEPIEILTQTKE